MKTCRPRHLVVAAVAVLGLAACSGNDPTDAGSAPLRSTSTTSTTSTTEAPTTTPAPPPPPDRGDQERSPGTTLPFVADTRPDTSHPARGFSVLVGLSRGEHPGYVRYVFEFEDHSPDGMRSVPARPAWDVRYVSRSEVVQDGSGFAVPVEGASVLRIAFEGAAMHFDDGTISLRQPVDAYDRLRLGGDFEGYVTWFLGLDGEQPFRAFAVDGGRVVVDVVTP